MAKSFSSDCIYMNFYSVLQEKEEDLKEAEEYKAAETSLTEANAVMG